MISQIQLCGAIMKHLDHQGVKSMLPRQVNAIAKAATAICAEFAKPYVPATPGMGWDAWLNSDDTGTSSVYLLHAIKCGWDKSHAKFGYPRDPTDFGRCIGLIDADPAYRAAMIAHMQDADKHGREWAALAKHWDELEAIYREELPSRQAPKLAARMEQLLKGVSQ